MIDTTHRQLHTATDRSSASLDIDLEFLANRKASGVIVYRGVIYLRPQTLDLKALARPIGDTKCLATDTLTLVISRPSLKESSVVNDERPCSRDRP